MNHGAILIRATETSRAMAMREMIMGDLFQALFEIVAYTQPNLDHYYIIAAPALVSIMILLRSIL